MPPDNHVSNFVPEWWNERRRRDYFVDSEGCVQLRVDSETGLRLAEKLLSTAYLMAAAPQGHA